MKARGATVAVQLNCTVRFAFGASAVSGIHIPPDLLKPHFSSSPSAGAGLSAFGGCLPWRPRMPDADTPVDTRCHELSGAPCEAALYPWSR